MRERRGALGSGVGGTASPAGQKARPGSPGLKVLLVFSSGFSCSFLILCVWRGLEGVTREPGSVLPEEGFAFWGPALLSVWRVAVLPARCGSRAAGRRDSHPHPSPHPRLLHPVTARGAPGRAWNPPPRRHGESRGAPHPPIPTLQMQKETAIPYDNLNPEESPKHSPKNLPPPQKKSTGSWHPRRPNTHAHAEHNAII